MTIKIFYGDKENDITPANDFNKMADLDNGKSRHNLAPLASLTISSAKLSKSIVIKRV